MYRMHHNWAQRPVRKRRLVAIDWASYDDIAAGWYSLRVACRSLAALVGFLAPSAKHSMRIGCSLGTYSRCCRPVGKVVCLAALVLAVATARTAIAHDPYEAILRIDRGGNRIPSASSAADELLEQGATLDKLLRKAAEANPVAKNWILSLAGAIADRQPAEVTRKALERFLADSTGDGEARYWALDRLSQGNSELRDKLLAGRTEDSSLDIRYEAIELELKRLPGADTAKADEELRKETIATYRRLLHAARLPQQINNIAAKLKELDEEVDLRSLLGFVSNWQAVGTFDNRKDVGFNAVYPPEADYLQSMRLDTSHSYTGKSGEAAWHVATTDKPDGKVDLNPIFNTEKGAVVYAYTIVDSPAKVNCQVRLGSPNANKVWVNGAEVTANNVYHTGSQIDQYVGAVTLKPGPNTVLVKVCQNEQTESWAADFSFQLRFTDVTGLAIPVSQ